MRFVYVMKQGVTLSEKSWQRNILFSFFTDTCLGCWAYVLWCLLCNLFHLWKRIKIRLILSNEVRLETSGAGFAYTFLNAELQIIHAQLLVRCLGKSHSQTEASAKTKSYSFPSDLTSDCVRAHDHAWCYFILLQYKEDKARAVRCCGSAYLPIWGKHKLLLVLNPAAGVWLTNKEA